VGGTTHEAAVTAGPDGVGSASVQSLHPPGPARTGILIDLYRARLASEQLFAAVILGSLLGPMPLR
jgi:hypothetical protein